MVMMSSMHLFIDDYVAVMSTSKEFTVARWLVDCFYLPLGVRICVVSLDHLCPKICPIVDC